jgi:hypothetical protein
MPKLANPSSDAVYLEGCVCKHETSAAILVEATDLDEETWVPKSQVHDDSEVCHKGDSGTLAVTQWFAERLGL